MNIVIVVMKNKIKNDKNIVVFALEQRIEE